MSGTSAGKGRPPRRRPGSRSPPGAAVGRGRPAGRAGLPRRWRREAPASSASRMTCCWGRMMRPLGAAESSGMTSTTTSPGVSRSPTSRRSSTAPVARVASARFRSLSPSPSAPTRARGRPVRKRHRFRRRPWRCGQRLPRGARYPKRPSPGAAKAATTPQRRLARFRKQIGLILRNHIGNAARLEGGEVSRRKG